jgi:hypothetical protein
MYRRLCAAPRAGFTLTKRHTMLGPLALVALALLLAEPAAAKKCKGDAVQVGGACVDKYEASVWEIAPANTTLIKKVQKSKVTSAADLAGATQRGMMIDDYGAGCPDTANGCMDFYAVSIAGVTPSRWLNWFQAAAACRNAGKRLATNHEWQMAALGTPDPGTDNGTSDCNISAAATAVNTGSRSSCVSDTGAFDMVGNLLEWVADWVPLSTACPGWGAFSSDQQCFGGAAIATGPGALLRGGDYNDGATAGPLSVNGMVTPSELGLNVGFRCVREL